MGIAYHPRFNGLFASPCWILLLALLIMGGPLGVSAWGAEVLSIKERELDAKKWGRMYASGTPIKPQLRWIGNGKAVVWAAVNVVRPISKKGHKIMIKGKNLVIYYRTEEEKVPPGSPVPGGGVVPEELEVTIANLPVREYSIEIREAD